MDISLRRCLTAGVATLTAAAVALGPAVQEPTPLAPSRVVQIASPPVQLAADVQPLAATDLPNLLVGWLERIVVPPSAGQPFPTPEFPPVVGGTGIDSTIKNVYNAVEPWVRYGFELATYAVGWIPYVGWLSGQIMIFYNFGERIARSITFNIADWLGGNVSFVQGLINVGVDTVNSFIQLGIDEWNFFLPPLPPLPPFPFAATQQTAAVTEDVSTATDTTQVNEKHSAVVPDKEATTDVVDNKTEADTVKESKEPKEPKEPKTTEVSAQGEVRGALDADTTVSTKVSNEGNGKKKADKGPTAKDATDSSTSAADNKNGKKKADKQ